MATAADVSKEVENGHRLRLLMDLATDTLRKKFHEHFPTEPADLYKELLKHKREICHMRIFNRYQIELLLPPSCLTDSSRFDISLLVLLLRIFCGYEKITKGYPLPHYASDAANILRIQAGRNHFAHSSGRFNDNVFDEIWTAIGNSLLSLGCNNQDLLSIKTDRSSHKICDEKLQQMQEKLDTSCKRVEILEKYIDTFDTQCEYRAQDFIVPVIPEYEKDSTHSMLAEKFRSQVMAEQIPHEHRNWLTIEGIKCVVFIENDNFKINTVGSSDIYIGYQCGLGWVAIKRCNMNENSETEIKILEENKWPHRTSKVIHYVTHFTRETRRLRFYYIIMELCENTLQQCWERYRNQNINMPFHECCKFALEFLQGLEEIHSLDILHMDLKPTNLLITLHGHLKIADFGISRKLAEGCTHKTTKAQGTNLWMSPNILGNTFARIRKEDDVMVAVMLLYYIFSGQHPFRPTGEINSQEECDKYINDIKKLNFAARLEDLYLQEEIRRLLDQWLTENKPLQINDIIKALENSHRITSVLHSHLPIVYMRTRGMRIAVLLSCSNKSWSEEQMENVIKEIEKGPSNDYLYEQCILQGIKTQSLESPRPDVTVLKEALTHCGFNEPIVRDDLTKSQFLEEIKKQLPPCSFNTPIVRDEEINISPCQSMETAEQIYIFLHISTHGFYDEDADENRIYLKGEYVDVKEIVDGIFDQVCNPTKINLILTIDACREIIKNSGNPKTKYPESAIVFYSVEKGIEATDAGSKPGTRHAPGAFASPTYFCQALADNLKPATKINDVINGVFTTIEKIGFLKPEVVQGKDSPLYKDFVL